MTHEDEMAALGAISPASHPGRDATHFRRLVAARELPDPAEAELRAAVAAARAAGDPWTIIGAALDIGGQAALERFGAGSGP